MIAPNDEPREIPDPEPKTPVDGAECIWDPWLISMYIDAVRTVERQRARPVH
jgi:hypothetical protein